MRISPIDPIVKIAHLGNVMSIDMMLPKRAIFTMGSMEKFFVFCQIQVKICFRRHKKRWRISCKFQFIKASNQKCIAKKPLTNLYDMNSNAYYEFDVLAWVLKQYLILRDNSYYCLKPLLQLSAYFYFISVKGPYILQDETFPQNGRLREVIFNCRLLGIHISLHAYLFRSQ